MILYYATDYDEPSGGMWACYRHVDVLNAHGIDAAVLHVEPGFRVSWFPNTTRIENMKEVVAHTNAIVVVSAIIEHQWPNLFPELRKVIFNQGAYLTFFPYPLGFTGPYHYQDALATIVVSEDNEDYLRYVFPDVPILRTTHGIDPDLYYYDPAEKLDQIAFVPSKNMEDAKQVFSILRERGIEMPAVPMIDMSREEAAAVLRKSRYFFSFGYPEGFGLPPCEAMGCGCIVAGYHAMGGREYLKEPYAFPVEQGDIIRFAQTAEELLAGDHRQTAQAAADFIAKRYSPEREQQSIVECWQQILAM